MAWQHLFKLPPNLGAFAILFPWNLQNNTWTTVKFIPFIYQISTRIIKSTEQSRDEGLLASFILFGLQTSDVDCAEILEQTPIKSNEHMCPDVQHIKTNISGQNRHHIPKITEFLEHKLLLWTTSLNTLHIWSLVQYLLQNTVSIVFLSI